MSVTTRGAAISDLPFLEAVDRHVAADSLVELVSAGRVMVVETAGEAVGMLRWGLFWDQIPFMNLLWILPAQRCKGFGTALVRAWEQSLLHAGHDQVLTSTMSNETAQRFYRKLDYVDCGALFLPGEPVELILRKPLE